MTTAERQVKTALVVGLGVSGQAVCELMVRRGIRVIATDLRPPQAFADGLERLRNLGCRLTLGRHDPRDFLAVDQIVVSPGVAGDLGPLVAAARQGIEVIGELEWAWRQVREPVVAISGTNGKTTTTTVVGELLKAAGIRAFVGGNIGTPLSRRLLDCAGGADGVVANGCEAVEVLVLEVSSFQLDTAPSFAPRVGVLLNITEDHLDRYQGFSGYIASKASLFSHQGPEDTAVINLDDPCCCRIMDGIRGRVLTFSRLRGDAHATCRAGRIEVRLPERAPFTLELGQCPLTGVHNEENLMAAVLCASAFGVDPDAIRRALPRLRPLAHRIEWVRQWRGIEFYDDSKGTNIGAVAQALTNFDRPIVLLVGGRDKGGSYQPLETLIRRRVKFIACFGEAGPRFFAAMAPWAQAAVYPELETAFQGAVAAAAAGDVVVLSPGCSSFDQYQSYAERGRHFQRLVAALQEPVQWVHDSAALPPKEAGNR